MYAKARCAALALLVMLAGLVSATENYMDYGGKPLATLFLPFVQEES